MDRKPLGKKAYGSIPHLPGSKHWSERDKGLSRKQASILTEKTRDEHDFVIVQEKLDGSCCSVAKLANGELVALTRSGLRARNSRFELHWRFDEWVNNREMHSVFDRLLNPGERIVGEWLAMAHGTVYHLQHMPFVAFDLFDIAGDRIPYLDFLKIIIGCLAIPETVHCANEPCSIKQAMDMLGWYGMHGAQDLAEGAVWRVERHGKVDFLGKYVRPEKEIGSYLPERSGKPAVWNI